MSEFLSINSLKISYNGTKEQIDVLHGVSLQLKQGESVGIVGESGSGKSQTALSVLKLIRGTPGITGGSITFNGTTISELTENQMSAVRGHEIGIIFQDARASLIPYLTIREQVLDTYKSLGENRTKEEFLKRAKELLDEMNFSDVDRVLSSYPGQLSGGECQRAYIMLSLLGNPKLLIADEPTSSLDPVTSVKIVDLLKSVCEKHNISLILISHDLGEVVRVTDYIYVFYNGYIVEEFPSSWLKDDQIKPLHPYTRFLFSMFSGKAFSDLRGLGGGDNRFSITEKVRNLSNSGIGCIYKERCSFQKTLSEEKQKWCNTSHPELNEWMKGGKAACWGAGEVEAGQDD